MDGIKSQRWRRMVEVMEEGVKGPNCEDGAEGLRSRRRRQGAEGEEGVRWCGREKQFKRNGKEKKKEYIFFIIIIGSCCGIPHHLGETSVSLINGHDNVLFCK